MKIIAGNSNLPLAEEISAYLEVPLADSTVRRFADNDVFVEILENMRGEDVFVVQSTSAPANDHLMELLRCAVPRRAASRLCCPISAMPAKTANPARARPFQPSWSPI